MSKPRVSTRPSPSRHPERAASTLDYEAAAPTTRPKSAMASRNREAPPDGLPGRWTRTWRTAWLSGRIGSSYLGGKVADVFRGRGERDRAEADRHQANAKRVLETMTRLRGPMMKLGQILSTQVEAMPGEYGAVLKRLQRSVPPMATSTIVQVLQDDLGEKPAELFAEFSDVAAAAASLGQVHRARLSDGTDVAVKVQYPGAERSVDADMANLQLAVSAAKRVFVDALGQERFDMTPMAEELVEHLTQETDYCREAYNAQLLAKLFADDPHIAVPRVHLSHSGLRVVTYDWFDGEPLEWGLTHPDQAIRERTARQLLHAFWTQLFRGGLLHADPHPGNFIIRPDGRLGLLDYGCVKVFPLAFLRSFAKMVAASRSGDQAGLRESLLELELLEGIDDELGFEDMKKITAYFSIGMTEDRAFSFADFDYAAAAKDLMGHFLRRRHPPPAQRDFLFLTRVVVAYYDYFSRSQARLNFHRLVKPYVEGGFAGRTIAIPPYG